MESDQLEKYLRKFSFSSPAPELRRQILTNARAEWSSESESEKNLFLRLFSAVQAWMRTLRLKHAIATGIFSVMLIAMIFQYIHRVSLQTNLFEQLKSARFLSLEISKGVEELAFSYEKWDSNGEKRKMIVESIQERFSISEVTGKL